MKLFMFIVCVFLCALMPLDAGSKKHKKSKKEKNRQQENVVAAPPDESIILPKWQGELRAKIARAEFPAWMTEQIQADLAPFEEGISQEDIQNTIDSYITNESTPFFVICRIKDHQFSYTPELPSHDSRALRLVGGLQELARCVSLPDAVFIVFTSDSFIAEGNKAPVFTWCRHSEWGKRTVNIPDYEALTGNYNFLQEVEQGARRYPWHAKIEKGIWRGTLSGGLGDPHWGEEDWDYMQLPRIRLCMVSNTFPNILDAKLIGQIGRREESRIRKRTLLYTGTFISISDQIRYKYQILADGYVCAFSRSYWQLFSNCVIFKQNSPWFQWYYRALKPYEHYIPYEADASDLIEKIQWAMKHDDQVQKISQTAKDFANANLKHSDVMLYVYLLLNEYAKLQNKVPQRT